MPLLNGIYLYLYKFDEHKSIEERCVLIETSKTSRFRSHWLLLNHGVIYICLLQKMSIASQY